MSLFRQGKISTGINELDILLEGGYQNPGSVAIVGPLGKEKFLFSYHFMSKNDGLNVYITTEATPQAVLEEFNQNSLEPRIDHFIDIYSRPAGIETKVSPDVSIVDSVTALNDISLELNAQLKKITGGKARVVINSLSAFLLYTPMDSLLRFIQVIEGRVKEKNGTIMFICDESVEANKLKTILHVLDEVYYIKRTKEGRTFLTSQSLPLDVPFSISSTGIIIK